VKVQLQNIVLFNDLDKDTIEKIEEFTSYCEIPKDSLLFYEGDSSEYLYLLTSGIIKLYKTSSQHKEIILKYFHPNELIGEVANFEQMPYPATAKAFTDAVLLKIDFDKLRDVILSNPKLAFKIQSSLIKKIKNLENIISSNLVLDSKERIAKYIYNNAEDFFTTKNIVIAEILGVSPETLSRYLKSFKDDGILDMKLKKVDKDRLITYFE